MMKIFQKLSHSPWSLVRHSQYFFLTEPQLIYIPGGSDGKESACNAGDPGSIPGPGRSPGEGNGKPLQYSCLENSLDRGTWQTTVHGVAKIQKRLGEFHFFICFKYTMQRFSIFYRLCPIESQYQIWLYSLLCNISLVLIYFMHNSLYHLILYSHLAPSHFLLPTGSHYFLLDIYIQY